MKGVGAAVEVTMGYCADCPNSISWISIDIFTFVRDRLSADILFIDGARLSRNNSTSSFSSLRGFCLLLRYCTIEEPINKIQVCLRL